MGDVLQVLNTNGAARRLGCTKTWIHKLVSMGKLKAYVYDDNGILVEHQPEQKRQGQGLYFSAADIDSYRTGVLRRSRGSRSIHRRTTPLRDEPAQNESPL
jgi:hypothetical protein